MFAAKKENQPKVQREINMARPETSQVVDYEASTSSDRLENECSALKGSQEHGTLLIKCASRYIGN